MNYVVFNEPLVLLVVSLLVIAIFAAIIHWFSLQRHRFETLYKHTQKEYESFKVSADSRLRKLLVRSQDEMRDSVNYYEQEIKLEQAKSRKYLSDKKSTEVRTGHILEKVAPLFEDFPVQVESGDVFPIFGSIDYMAIIHNGDDAGVYLIEVKSGNAGLSQRQRSIKKMVENGQVYFRTFRKSGKPEEKNQEEWDKDVK